MKLRSGALGAAAAAATLLAVCTAQSAAHPSGRLPVSAGQVVTFAFGPKNTVYAGTAPGSKEGRIYESTDAGRDWRLISARRWTWFDALAADPRHRGVLYAGTGNEVYRTNDDGRTWRASNKGLLPPPGVNRAEGWVEWLGVDPAHVNVVYELDYADTLRTSSDGGQTWRVSAWRTPLGFMHGTAVAWTRTPVIYAWFGGWTTGQPAMVHLTLGRSVNGGRVWRRTRLQVSSRKWPSSAVAVDVRHPRTVYVAAHSKVFVSQDAGAHWQSIGAGLPQNADVTNLVIGTGAIYALLRTHTIWESTDRGGTWRQSWPQSGPAPGLGVSMLAVDPQDLSTVFASAYYPQKRSTGTHIIRSTDRGRTWTVVG